MVTDPISDLLVRLRNGFRRHHDVVTVPVTAGRTGPDGSRFKIEA